MEVCTTVDNTCTGVSVVLTDTLLISCILAQMGFCYIRGLQVWSTTDHESKCEYTYPTVKSNVGLLGHHEADNDAVTCSDNSLQNVVVTTTATNCCLSLSFLLLVFLSDCISLTRLSSQFCVAVFCFLFFKVLFCLLFLRSLSGNFF